MQGEGRREVPTGKAETGRGDRRKEGGVVVESQKPDAVVRRPSLKIHYLRTYILVPFVPTRNE